MRDRGLDEAGCATCGMSTGSIIRDSVIGQTKSFGARNERPLWRKGGDASGSLRREHCTDI